MTFEHGVYLYLGLGLLFWLSTRKFVDGLNEQERHPDVIRNFLHVFTFLFWWFFLGCVIVGATKAIVKK